MNIRNRLDHLTRRIPTASTYESRLQEEIESLPSIERHRLTARFALKAQLDREPSAEEITAFIDAGGLGAGWEPATVEQLNYFAEVAQGHDLPRTAASFRAQAAALGTEEDDPWA